MAKFSLLTRFRPPIGVEHIPITFAGNFVTTGVMLTNGEFLYTLDNSDLISLVHSGRAQVILGETGGHYFAEISLIRRKVRI